MADDSNLAEAQSHAGRAGELEKDAADLLEFRTDGGDARAAAAATLALSHRVAALADVLFDGLDEIKGEIGRGLGT